MTNEALADDALLSSILIHVYGADLRVVFQPATLLTQVERRCTDNAEPATLPSTRAADR
jgi:hypothetical protein